MDPKRLWAEPQQCWAALDTMSSVTGDVQYKAYRIFEDAGYVLLYGVTPIDQETGRVKEQCVMSSFWLMDRMWVSNRIIHSLPLEVFEWYIKVAKERLTPAYHGPV